MINALRNTADKSDLLQRCTDVMLNKKNDFFLAGRLFSRSGAYLHKNIQIKLPQAWRSISFFPKFATRTNVLCYRDYI